MLIGLHCAVLVGTVSSHAVMRYVRGTPRLRFMLAAARPHASDIAVHVDALRPGSLDVAVCTDALRSAEKMGRDPVAVPIAVEEPLAQELEPLCREGLPLVICGHFAAEKRQHLTVLEVVADEVWLL